MAEAEIVAAAPAGRLPSLEATRRTGGTALWIVLFLAPFIALYAGFTLWPLLATVAYSLFDWDGIRPLSHFIGLGNYQKIAADPVFWKAFTNTLIFAVLNTIIKLPPALVLAIVLTRKWLWLKRIFRTVFFVPVILPVSVAGLIFTYLLNPSNGSLNAVLRGVGLVHQPIDLLGHDNTALMALVLISVWQVFGQYLIYWMAALQNVPDDLYEVAEIDGSGEWSKLRHITLPMIRPMAVIITLLALVNALHVFGLVVTLTSGGPGRSTYVMSYFIYTEAFSQIPYKYGYASAAALLFGVLALIFVTTQGFFARKAEILRRAYGV
ncbi:MAG TPA: sugar ABC transporter permease [Dehalococcoidia bacterium]|nr:sugar ABC transporter permease [Dehalococcoidia bacterium]